MTFVWITSYLFVLFLGGVASLALACVLFPSSSAKIDGEVGEALDEKLDRVANPFIPTILRYDEKL